MKETKELKNLEMDFFHSLEKHLDKKLHVGFLGGEQFVIFDNNNNRVVSLKYTSDFSNNPDFISHLFNTNKNDYFSLQIHNNGDFIINKKENESILKSTSVDEVAKKIAEMLLKDFGLK